MGGFDDYSDLDERIKQHDPTGSFSKDEIMSLITIMNMPVTLWADMVRTGKATGPQIQQWMEKLDAIKPGYGQYFLGDSLKSEEEQIEGGVRRAVNWIKKDGQYVKCYGEPRTGMIEAHIVKKDDLDVENDLKEIKKDHERKTAFDWVDEIEEPKTQEQLDAWKKLQDAKYEYMKSMMENRK